VLGWMHGEKRKKGPKEQRVEAWVQFPRACFRAVHPGYCYRAPPGQQGGAASNRQAVGCQRAGASTPESESETSDACSRSADKMDEQGWVR
jgi:hypothetical protein